MKASREAELAINVAIDNGFVDAIAAARAVPKAPLEQGVDYTVRDWIEYLRGTAGPSWSKMEMSETAQRWSPPPRVLLAVGAKVAIKIAPVKPTKALASKAAVAMLKAEDRCSAADLARGVEWLMKQPAAYWAGTGTCCAFRRCDPTSAFDWYVLLVVELHQWLGVDISGFETYPGVVESVRRKRRHLRPMRGGGNAANDCEAP
jgi:hypothetical protein